MKLWRWFILKVWGPEIVFGSTIGILGDWSQWRFIWGRLMRPSPLERMLTRRPI